jgi:hypothetical protein
VDLWRWTPWRRLGAVRGFGRGADTEPPGDVEKTIPPEEASGLGRSDCSASLMKETNERERGRGRWIHFYHPETRDRGVPQLAQEKSEIRHATRSVGYRRDDQDDQWVPPAVKGGACSAESYVGKWARSSRAGINLGTVADTPMPTGRPPNG